MNWEAIGTVGEIVGAFAVVASLAYLAVQIRTQVRQQKKAAWRLLPPPRLTAGDPSGFVTRGRFYQDNFAPRSRHVRIRPFDCPLDDLG